MKSTLSIRNCKAFSHRVKLQQVDTGMSALKKRSL